MQQRKFIDFIIIGLKGMAMGAADVVPGVSGGTIAFISGIYEELLTSINNVNFKTLKLLKTDGFKKFWKAMNGPFLLALLAGILFSIFSLAELLAHLIETSPVLVWSFFFGLVLASVIYVGKQISNWKISTVLIFLAGAFIAYYITTLRPLVSDDSSPYMLFFAGALAICAMILPGISGAFILVLIGAYKTVLDAANEMDYKSLLIFAAGAVIGLLSFAKLLKWLFKHYRNAVLALLTGFILGSLNKIWPWKTTLTWRTNSKGIEVPLNEMSVLPAGYDGDPQLVYAVILAGIGFLLIILLEKLAQPSKN